VLTWMPVSMNENRFPHPGGGLWQAVHERVNLLSACRQKSLGGWGRNVPEAFCVVSSQLEVTLRFSTLGSRAVSVGFCRLPDRRTKASVGDLSA
jgi:hypothetical protein